MRENVAEIFRRYGRALNIPEHNHLKVSPSYLLAMLGHARNAHDKATFERRTRRILQNR